MSLIMIHRRALDSNQYDPAPIRLTAGAVWAAAESVQDAPVRELGVGAFARAT